MDNFKISGITQKKDFLIPLSCKLSRLQMNCKDSFCTAQILLLDS